MSTKFDWRGISIFGAILFFISLPFAGNYATSNNSGPNQSQNFQDDLKNAGVYWAHNDRGFDYVNMGHFDKAVSEYKKAIEVIEKAPDEYERTDVTKEYKASVNRELRVQSQIFSRYGLIKALEGAGRYEEAIQNVDWLQQNQVIKGKEELLRQKLEGMKQSLLQKMQQSQNKNSGDTK